MNGLRPLGRVGFAIARAMWSGDLTTKLSVVVRLAVGVGFLGSVAGPATAALSHLLVLVALLFAICGLLLRR